MPPNGRDPRRGGLSRCINTQRGSGALLFSVVLSARTMGTNWDTRASVRASRKSFLLFRTSRGPFQPSRDPACSYWGPRGLCPQHQPLSVCPRSTWTSLSSFFLFSFFSFFPPGCQGQGYLLPKGVLNGLEVLLLSWGGGGASGSGCTEVLRSFCCC